jgi:RES domain-containing protein
VEGFYLADSEATAWAEWYRHLAELAVPPEQQLPRDLWKWRVDVRVANLSTPARLKKVGLPAPPPPGRASWSAFQAVGHELYADGWAGLLAPSAARPAGRVLCLFRESVDIPGAKPKGPPLTYDTMPLVPIGLTT